MKKEQILVHAGLLLVALIYGGTFVIAKDIMPTYIGPFGFILVRVVIALMLISIVQVVFIKEKINARNDLVRLIICGFFGSAANMLMFFKGLSFTSPINASLIMTSTPVIVLVFAAILVQENINLKKLLGVLLGGTGAILMILNSPGKDPSNLEFTSYSWVGDLLVFLNASSYATYLVLVKPLMKKYHPLTVIRWTFTFGTLFVLPFGYDQLVNAEWSEMTLPIWSGLAFVVFGTTFLAYLINAWSLRYVSPSITGAYIYFQPVFATIIATAFRDFIFTFQHFIFGSMIFIGVFLVSFPSTLLQFKNLLMRR